MDERRSVPIEADRDEPGRRGTPLWLQAVVSIVVIGAAVLAWAWLSPGARDQLAAWGVVIPGLEPVASATAPQGNTPGASPGGRPGAGGFPARGAGGRTAVVVTAPATSAVINDALTAIGEGVAAQSVTITAAASGTLVRVAVSAGQTVAAGDVIAELDSGTQQIAFDRARLAADDAAAALARAEELRRAQSLSSVQLNAAQLASDQAQLELRNAELALQARRITTPIAGTVGLIQVTPGNLVSAQTVVTTVQDASDILINFWVPERYVSAIRVGMEVTATAVALPGQTFAGRVGAVDNRVDPQSRTLQVQAELANPDGLLRPGMSFQVEMAFPGERYVAVDPLAIQWSSEGAYVWKYAEGKVSRAMIAIVQRNSDGVLVSGDVAEGDQVVTQGVLQLQEGQTVRLLDEPVTGNGRPPDAANQSPGQGTSAGPEQARRPGTGNGQGAPRPGADQSP